jgi:hypothetical protein
MFMVVEVLLRRWFALRDPQVALVTAAAVASCNRPGPALWVIMNRAHCARERVGIAACRWQHGQILADEPNAE